MRRRIRFALGLAGALLLGAHAAYAQPHEASAGDRDTVRKLLDDGDAAMAKKDFAGALKLYQGARGYMDVPVTAFSVAQAQAGLKLYLEARDTALAVGRLPKGTNEPNEFLQARKDADALATKLDGLIPSIQVQVNGAPADAAPDVSVDGDVVPAASALLPRRVNPGKHHVDVKLAGFAPGSADLDLTEGSELVPVKIDLKPAGSDANGNGNGNDHPQPEPSGGKKINILLPIGGAVAGAGLIITIGTGAAALSKGKPAGNGLADAADVALAFTIAGAGVGIVGLVLTLTSHDTPAAKQDPKPLTLEPIIGPTYAGLRGRVCARPRTRAESCRRRLPEVGSAHVPRGVPAASADARGARARSDVRGAAYSGEDAGRMGPRTHDPCRLVAPSDSSVGHRLCEPGGTRGRVRQERPRP